MLEDDITLAEKKFITLVERHYYTCGKTLLHLWEDIFTLAVDYPNFSDYFTCGPIVGTPNNILSKMVAKSFLKPCYVPN